MKKYYLVLLGTVLTVFIISANIAWLNPRPQLAPTYKISEKMPFLWQYNIDSRLSLATAAYFPEGLKQFPTRINRPLIHALAHYLGYLPFAISSLFIEWEGLGLTTTDILYGRTILGYLIVKLILYIIFAIVAFRLLRNYFDDNTSLLAVILILIHPYPVTFLCMYHASDMQFITPVIVSLLLLDICRNYSVKKNIIYSLVIGFLMLAKQNYSVYVGVLLFGLFRGEFKKTSLSFFLHLLPLAGWLVFLKLKGIPYFSGEIQGTGSVLWFFSDINLKLLPIDLLKKVFDNTNYLLKSYADHFFIWGLIAFLFCSVALKNRLKAGEKEFLVCFLIGIWIQGFAVYNQVSSYITADLSFIVYGVTAIVLMEYLRKRISNDRVIIALVAGIALLWSLTTIINLPWVHPYDQGL